MKYLLIVLLLGGCAGHAYKAGTSSGSLQYKQEEYACRRDASQSHNRLRSRELYYSCLESKGYTVQKHWMDRPIWDIFSP